MRVQLRRAAEAIAVLASPGAFYAVLRLRGMAPVQLPDPSLHTTFIVDPRDIFTRYAAAFAPTARMREGARVGFLVPARTAYLLFGPVGGFFTLRYVLALVAVVPLYVLLKRLYGRWAGFLGIAVVMSNPVFVTAWGTDYPDSAAISYLTGGLCALAMPCEARRRPWWLATAAGLFTMAVWSHGAALPLGAAVLVAYAVVRGLRTRDRLASDAAVLLVTAVAVTGLLSLFSMFLLGQANFISPTLRAARDLNSPAQIALWHSSNWRWVLYDTYLLVPPAALLAFLVVHARRWRRLGTPQLFIGFASVLTGGAAAYLQFVGTVQMLEQPFFSSLLWSFVAVLVALTLAELAAPFVGRVAARRTDHVTRRSGTALARGSVAARHALPMLLVVAVALVYEADPHVPAMKLDHWGWAVAAIAVAAALVWRLGVKPAARPAHAPAPARMLRDFVPPAVLVVLAGALLILTVAPKIASPPLTNLAKDDFQPAYARALGGNDATYIDEYQVTCELPGFVGHPTYAGEQLLTWQPEKDLFVLTEPAGIFHSSFDAVTGPFPWLIAANRTKIEQRRPAQMLLMSLTGTDFSQAVSQLSPFQPLVVRRGVLSDDTFHLHVWLVDLRRYLLPTRSDQPRGCRAAASCSSR